MMIGSRPGGLAMRTTASDGDILEPLPVYEGRDRAGCEPVARRLSGADLLRRVREIGDSSATQLLAVPELRAQDSASSLSPGRLSAVFTRIIDVHPARLGDLERWWWRQAGHGRVRVARRLFLDEPRRDASGTWRMSGALRSP